MRTWETGRLPGFWSTIGGVAAVVLAAAVVVGSAAGCGSSDPAPGVAVLRDTQTPDTRTGDAGAPPDAAADTGPETVACTDDEACKAAFPDPPDCRVPRCEDGACALAAAADGVACGVGDPCWIDGACAGGACVGARVDCDDGNPCTVDDCDADLGCFYATEPLDGEPCDDRKPWTDDDRCDAGRCVGEVGPCECASDAECADQDDGDRCNGVPVCRECVCVPGEPVRCDTSADGDCAATACDPATGDCVRAPVADGTVCDDDSRCTEDDRCVDGVCEGAPRDCDDDNPCTNDACDPRAGCVHFENAATCDDGDACTRNDACVEGFCVGNRRSCDDADPCTADSCDPAAGCVNEALTGTPCDDRFVCTESDVCQDGVCVGTDNTCVCESDADCAAWGDGDLCQGTLSCVEGRCVSDPDDVVTCPPPDPDGCVRYECAPATGTCEPFALDDGIGCDDGDACTRDDACAGGVCVGGAVDCDDGNPCTDDACDAATGCVHVDNDDPCDDDNACTVGTRCAGGVCGGGSPRVCDDDRVCTRDACDVEAGCVNEPLSGPTCDDGDACTTDDACDEGECLGGAPLVCADERPCTNDGCDPEKGCVFEPDDGAQCDDLDPCTTGDVCQGSDCVGTGTLDCDDGNPCTSDACTPGAGCVHTPNTGAACDDGDPCTEGDTCSGGVCVGGETACDCTVDADCAPLEDGDRCNGTLVCDTSVTPFACVVDPATVVTCDDTNDTVCLRNTCVPDSGACVPTPIREGQPCDDGDACTRDDVCAEGACEGGPDLLCDDRDPCTDDACDPDEGCVYTWNEADCDDGDACTDGDRCSDGQCVPGEPLDCDDGDPCTYDRCDATSGCRNPPSSEPCDDGDACTTDDVCVDGDCVGGASLDCDDGNPCTDDRCDPESGCVHDAHTGTCDDGDPCTVGDTCVEGACVPETVIDCDDGNPCTSDVCRDDGSCSHVVLPYGTACDDGAEETVADQCDAAGACVGWLRGDVFRSGAANTLLTDVTYSRFVVGFSLIDAMYVTGSDRIDGAAWTWVGRLGTTTLFVEDQFQGDTLVALSYRLAVGERGLLLRHDGTSWNEVSGLGSALDPPDGAILQSVHGYWTRRLLDGQAMTAETFYVGGAIRGSSQPLLWRCRWSATDIIPPLGWDCTPQTVPEADGVPGVWGRRSTAAIGSAWTDGPAWALLGQANDVAVTRAGAVAAADASSDTWSTEAPAGCSGDSTTPCAGAIWADLAGNAAQMWAVGQGGRLMRHTGTGWERVSVPASALWEGTAIDDYDFRAVRVTASRGVHLAGQWTGCLDDECGDGSATHRRLFFLHYDPNADRWDGVRELFLARCPGPSGGTATCPSGWLERYEVVAMAIDESDGTDVVVIGNRPIASANGEDSAGLVFHLLGD